MLWLGLCFASLVALPAAIYVSYLTGFKTNAVPYILGSGLLHALYFIFLAKAYEKGDLSTVYPLARGTGVLGTALLARILLHETISALGFFAVASVLMGILLIITQSTPRNWGSLRFALLEGLSIIGYSLTDKAGISIINPIIYICLMFLVTALLLGPWVLCHYHEKMVEAWQKQKKSALVIGSGSLGTYLMVLYAFRISNVSYVVAAREFSVVIGTLLGVAVLKERFTLTKGVSITAITLGLVLMKMA